MQSSMDCWLAENSFFCEHYEVRLSLEACKRYRQEDNYYCKDCDVANDADPLPKTIRFSSSIGGGSATRKPLFSQKEKKVRRCKEPGCDSKHAGRGWCRKHYNKYFYNDHLKRKRGQK